MNRNRVHASTVTYKNKINICINPVTGSHSTQCEAQEWKWKCRCVVSVRDRKGFFIYYFILFFTGWVATPACAILVVCSVWRPHCWSTDSQTSLGWTKEAYQLSAWWSYLLGLISCSLATLQTFQNKQLVDVKWTRKRNIYAITLLIFFMY